MKGITKDNENVKASRGGVEPFYIYEKAFVILMRWTKFLAKCMKNSVKHVIVDWIKGNLWQSKIISEVV